jgi:glycosyltransferase involved in cell wall biosynthesis
MAGSEFRRGESTIFQIGLSCGTIPPDGYGGIETVVANLSQGLADQGERVVLYSPGKTTLSNVEHIQTLEYPSLGPARGVYTANSAEHLRFILENLTQRYSPGDVIHLHHREQYLIYEGLGLALTTETAHWRSVGLSKNLIYPSFALQREVNRPGVVIPHGINLSLFNYDKELSRDEEFIIYAGRLTKDKGVDIASAACKAAGLSLKLAGPIPDTDFAKKMCDVNEYLGVLRPSELRNYFNRALASIYMTQYNEPFGLSIVESLACGCPVIVSGCGATREIVQEGISGFICESVSDIVAALSRVHQLHREQCTQRASEFGLERMVASVLEMYSDLNA